MAIINDTNGINEKDRLFEEDNNSGENTGPLLPNPRGRYLTASSLTGDKVVNNNNEHLGEIKDIMLDLQAGKIDYFVIEFGGFLGLGVKYFAIPFRLLALDAPNKQFVRVRPAEDQRFDRACITDEREQGPAAAE